MSERGNKWGIGLQEVQSPCPTGPESYLPPETNSKGQSPGEKPRLWGKAEWGLNYGYITFLLSGWKPTAA